ncbi:MAG TPA: type II restriction endonuclease [Pyrinomonadaceae bacterium]|jgi:type II restriction enzyme|nr:type II restriction endonuclease [Pyrinomonadaceae bacterium]
MQSPFCGRAIENVIRYGNALLKYISPNDVGLTGGHQCGFYLPKSVYQMFTPHPPTKGENSKHPVTIEWQDDIVTESVVTWYGKGTRSEYRLTRFGPDFPFLAHDTVGDLLVLIPKTEDEFLAYVLDLEEDIEEIQAALGVEVHESWGIYQQGEPQAETEDECVARYFRRFAEALTEFPRVSSFSEETRRALTDCIRRFAAMSADDVLMKSMDAEYQLFRLVERQICQREIVRVFRDVDDFLQTASSIMNRRKARAGRSLENHVEFMLRDARIPHEMRPNIDGKPDVVIPSRAAYYDNNYPLDRLFIVGVKTTCKDRWRQVLNEGKRVRIKHILTTQPTISRNQLNEMHAANVTLVVPHKLHRDYPKERDITLLNLEQFVMTVRTQLA